jgi:alpha-mannosidase
MGFVWLDEGSPAQDANDSANDTDAKKGDAKKSDAKKKDARAKPLIADSSGDEHRLRNEFLDVVIDPHTGGIRSLRENGGRHNRLSQQLALRAPAPPAEPGSVWRDPDEAAVYSVMAADTVEVTSAGPAVGEIVSRGRLVDRKGVRLADFVQTVQLARGSRVLVIDVQLDWDTMPVADPWSAYYAMRWAWYDETADLYRSVGLGRFASDARRIEAPQYIEINESPRSATVLSGGLPYHRRCGKRMLDTLLVVAGEQRRRFRLGVGLDLAHPARDALAMTTPACWSRDEAGPPAAGPVGWFFHVDARNVVATHWEPINAVSAADDGSSAKRSDVVGFRVRLLETEGRTGQITLQAYRPISAAQQIDFRGEVLAECAVRDGAAIVETTNYEWVQLEVFWAD